MRLGDLRQELGCSAFFATVTFIIAEPEPVGALSARKLVIETAKFNEDEQKAEVEAQTYTL